MFRNPIAILIIAGFLVYFNSLFNSFVWDDEEQVLNNTLVHSISNLPSFFSSSTFNSGGAGQMGGLYYKPLMTTLFSLLYTVFGPNAFFFHLFQLLLHLANGVMVFLLFKHLFNLYPEKTKQLLPFLLALIFLIHPINTEAVVYISDLQDILFFFFGMLATLLTIKTQSFNFKKIILIASLLLFALLSKETGALFFPLIFLYLFFFQKKLIFPYLVSSFLAVGLYAFLRFAVAGIFFNKHGLSPITKMPLEERVLSIPKIIYSYLKNFILPQNLAINQHWAVTSMSWDEFYFPLIIVLIFFTIISVILFLLWRYQKNTLVPFIFFLSWFILTLGLHLQVFPLDLTFSDRWFYLPIVGLLGMMGIVINQFKIEKSKIILGLIVLVIISGLSIRTIIRNTNWRDGLTLYSHDVLISKDSFDLENNLGVELFRTGKMDEAKVHFEKSTQLAPDWWTNWNNLGVVAERKKEYSLAKNYYQKAIDNGQYYLAYENLANILFFQEDPQKAKEFTEESLKKLPQNAKLWLVLSMSEYKLNNKDVALQAARNSYLLSPSPQAYYLYSRLSENLPIEF